MLRKPNHPRINHPSRESGDARYRPRPRGSRAYHRFLLEALEERRLLTIVIQPHFGDETIFWGAGNMAGEPANMVVTAPLASNPAALQDPKVYFIFWGAGWTQQVAQQFATDAQTLINSPFLSGLTEYGSDGEAQYGGFVVDSSVAPPDSPSQSTNEISKIVPTTNWDRPPVDTSAHPGKDSSAVGSPIYVTLFDNGPTKGAGNGTDVYAPSGSVQGQLNHIWMGTDGKADFEQSFTMLLSHELAERISAGGGGILMSSPARITTEFKNAQIADDEPNGAPYTYRIDNLVVQAYWSIRYNAFMVPDGNSQVVDLIPNWTQTSKGANVFENSFSLDVNSDSTAGETDTIDDSNGGMLVTLDGQAFRFGVGRITGIVLQTPATVNVLNTLVPVTIESTATNNVTIGADGTVQGINAAVTVINNQFTSGLTIDDSQDASPHSAVSLSVESLIGLSPQPIFFEQSEIGGLSILSGTGIDDYTVINTPFDQALIPTTTTINTNATTDTINVLGTTGALTIDGEGNDTGSSDTINIGSRAPSFGGTLANILAPISITNQSGANVNIDDSADPNVQTADLNTNSFTGFGLPAAIDFTGSQLHSLTIYGGSGINTFNVHDTAAGHTSVAPSQIDSIINVLGTTNPLTLDGFDLGKQAAAAIYVGSQAPSLGGTLANIQGSVTTINFSKSDLTLDDSADAAAQTATINSFAISGLGMGGNVSFANGEFAAIKVVGGTGDDTFNVINTSTKTEIDNNSEPGVVNVQRTTQPLLIDAQNFAVNVNVGTTAPSLGGTLAQIRAPITIQNNSVQSDLTLDDSGQNLAGAGTLTPTLITGFGMPAPGAISCSQNEKMDVTIHTSQKATKATIIGNTGNVSLIANASASNTLIGPAKKATSWDITGANSGSIPALHLNFTNFGSLVGGAFADTFAMSPGASLSSIDGGAGKNVLDYTAFAGNVAVNLKTGTATGIHKLANITVVNGATGGGAGFYNILVGSGHDTLTGGNGRDNLLEAGGPGSTLQGGDGNDILIGGTSTYDKQPNLQSLVNVMNLWSTSTQSYADLVTAIRTGTGVPALNKTTLHSAGQNEALLGHNGTHSEMNLYFGPRLQSSDQNSDAGEVLVII